VDLARVGRGLVYLSLVFSFASAVQYVQLFTASGGPPSRRDGRVA